MKTPPNKWIFLLLLNLSWFGTLPAEIDHYEYHLAHGFYPSSADSIGIPIFQTAIALAVLSPFLNLIAFLLLRRTKLPAPIFYSSKAHRILNAVHSTICVMLIGFIFYEAVVGDVPETFCWRLPVLILQAYLLASSRAGLLLSADEKSLKIDLND